MREYTILNDEHNATHRGRISDKSNSTGTAPEDRFGRYFIDDLQLQLSGPLATRPDDQSAHFRMPDRKRWRSGGSN